MDKPFLDFFYCNLFKKPDSHTFVKKYFSHLESFGDKSNFRVVTIFANKNVKQVQSACPGPAISNKSLVGYRKGW